MLYFKLKATENTQKIVFSQSFFSLIQAIVNRTSVINSGIAGILNVVHIMRITYMQPSADGIGITEIQAYTTRSRFLKQLRSTFWTELAVVFLFTVRTIHILCIIRYNYFVLKTLVTAPFVVTSTMDFCKKGLLLSTYV